MEYSLTGTVSRREAAFQALFFMTNFQFSYKKTIGSKVSSKHLPANLNKKVKHLAVSLHPYKFISDIYASVTNCSLEAKQYTNIREFSLFLPSLANVALREQRISLDDIIEKVLQKGELLSIEVSVRDMADNGRYLSALYQISQKQINDLLNYALKSLILDINLDLCFEESYPPDPNYNRYLSIIMGGREINGEWLWGTENDIGDRVSLSTLYEPNSDYPKSREKNNTKYIYIADILPRMELKIIEVMERIKDHVEKIIFLNPTDEWVSDIRNIHLIFNMINQCKSKIIIRIKRTQTPPRYWPNTFPQFIKIMNKFVNDSSTRIKEYIYSEEYNYHIESTLFQNLTVLKMKSIDKEYKERMFYSIMHNHQALKVVKLIDLGQISGSLIQEALSHIECKFKFEGNMKNEDYSKLFLFLFGEDSLIKEYEFVLVNPSSNVSSTNLKIELTRKSIENKWNIEKSYFQITTERVSYPDLEKSIKHGLKKLIFSSRIPNYSIFLRKEQPTTYDLNKSLEILGEEMKKIISKEIELKYIKLSSALEQPLLRKLLSHIKGGNIREISLEIYSQWSGIWRVIRNTYKNKWIQTIYINIHKSSYWPRIRKDKDIEREKFFSKIRGIKTRIIYWIKIDIFALTDNEKYLNPNIQFI